MIESVADFVLRVPGDRTDVHADGRRHFTADVRLRRGARSWSKRRPAAEPRQDGDGRIVATVGVGIDVVDVPRFEIVLGRRRESSSDSSRG